jgi:hypothetical protein
MSEEFSVSKWVSNGMRGIRDTLRGQRAGLLPEAFHEHMRASRKEVLMAFRSLFDAAIERCDASKQPPRRKATKIKVE